MTKTVKTPKVGIKPIGQHARVAKKVLVPIVAFKIEYSMWIVGVEANILNNSFCGFC